MFRQHHSSGHQVMKARPEKPKTKNQKKLLIVHSASMRKNTRK
jgi:hypothetical protein